MQTYKPNYKGNSKQIKKAIELIEASKKPLFYLGGGVISSNASEAVRKLIEITQIPAVETLMALGALDSNDPNCLNMVGMHGSYAANMAMSEADLIIALGARFDDRVTGKVSEFAKNAKIIHVDIDPSSISKIINADFPIVGDVKSVVEDMIERAKDEINPKNFNTWHEIITNYSRIHPLTYKDSDEVLKPQWVIEETARNLPNDAIVTTDVGQHQMWVAQYFPFKYPRTFLTSGGLGTMGYSLPASMGAKLAHPAKEVVNFVGDGSVLMNIQELMTMIQSNIKVIHIILNNGFLGMVRQWQSLFYGERFSSTNIELQPDFVKLIESFGGLGFRATNKEEFSSALKTALSSNKVSFIDAHIDRFENVMPMVPAGGVLYNMILE